MAERSREQIEEKLAELAERIRTVGPVMRGSVTVMGRRHKQPYFSASIKGRTRVLYLGAERAETARRCVANYRRLAALVDEMTLLQMELLKTEGKRYPKRPTP